MKRKKNKPGQPAQSGPPKRKMSEMISEFAGAFIRLGKTPEAKQNYLNGACVAWNIASAPPERRKKLVDHFLAGYKQHNPSTDEAALAAILNTMGDHVDEPILELTEDRLLLLDQDGKTKYDWKRVRK
ncbi:MAG: hypothetical protein ABR915_16865 [Thermoguttaceae bacterium]|jgi:hypothetical protein